MIRVFVGQPMTVNDLSTICLFTREFHFKVLLLTPNGCFYPRFRGGKGDEWKSNVDSYIYYNNLSVRQISK